MDSSDCETLVEDEVTFKEFLEMYYTALGFSGENDFRFDSLESIHETSFLMSDIYSYRTASGTCPRNFLPNERHILISNSERHVVYKTSTAYPFLQRVNPCLPPIYQQRVKYPYKIVNGTELYVSPFAIIVNAYSKLVDRNFKKIVPAGVFAPVYGETLDEFRNGLRTLMQEIFYLPAGHPFCSTLGLPQSDETIQDRYDTGTTMKGSHSDGCDSGDPECPEQDQTESSDEASQDRESSDNEDNNELSASGPFFGLTPQDIQTAAQKSVDPRVDADQRIMAALMLGGMLRSGLKVSD
ncbi:hypothetical protein VNI00_018456 [Paramarasmius palmivorus]|uniref:Uncharacterized protein n=1 Tax=Paramarasmius palmivorus TaxID=297713 RepID=A0AAW0AWL0_9AGAR